MTAKGIDISVIQGDIDFNALKTSGIEFCIIRCFVGNQSVDKLYASNVSKAKAAGLKVASYHFVFPLPGDGTHPNRSPQEQAKLHFDNCLTDVVCVDCEWPIPQDWKKWGCTSTQINQWILDYLKAYEQLSGHKPIVYTYPNFAQNVKFSNDFTQYPLWIASYQSSPQVPKPWTDWAIWQTGGGNLMHLPNGCPVDTNVAKDLSLWDDTVVPTTTPATTNDGSVFSKAINLISSLFK